MVTTKKLLVTTALLTSSILYAGAFVYAPQLPLDETRTNGRAIAEETNNTILIERADATPLQWWIDPKD